MKVQEKLLKYIQDNGIKQKFISDKTGIPENTLSMSLNAKRTLTAEEFVKIVLLLKIDIEYFN